MANNLENLFRAEASIRRWTAERELASAKLELARQERARAYLISQYDPVEALGVDRRRLRVLLDFVAHGDDGRLLREAGAVVQQQSTVGGPQ